MRPAIDSGFRKFLFDQGYLVLEDLLKAGQLALLEEVGAKVNDQRDLWRKDSRLERLWTRSDLSAMIAQIWSQEQPRLLFDQILGLEALEELRDAPLLSELFCFEPVLGLLVFCLKEPQLEVLNTEEQEELETEEQVALKSLPLRKNQTLILKGTEKLKLPEGYKMGSGKWLVLGIGAKNARYKEAPKDPYLHELKKMDYYYGHFLKDATHPLLRESH